MNRYQLIKCMALVLFLACGFPQPAMAYVGPGTGMSAVGVFLAVAVGVVIALFGFVWYPFKRLLRTWKKCIAVKKDEPAV
jgi:flagellar biogenesis protein FliO